jgi:hypothetical protein
VARLGLSTAAEITKTVLPSLNPHGTAIVPEVVKTTLQVYLFTILSSNFQGTSQIVKTGTRTIKERVDTVTTVGALIGSEVGSAIKAGMDTTLPPQPGDF